MTVTCDSTEQGLTGRGTAGHRASEQHGPCVIDGRLSWLSATIIASSDPTQAGGCLRRWWYHYSALREEPETTAQTAGKELHAQIEEYLTTGAMVLGPLALTGRHLIPRPGVEGGLFVEHQLEEGTLTANGIPIHGHSDLIVKRYGYITPQGEIAYDPFGTVEVIDWKTTSSVERWAKTGQELAANTQMITYGEYAARRWHAEHIRLSHVYFQSKGPPRAEKRTILLSRVDVAERWRAIEGHVERMITAARATSPDEVEPNEGACDAFLGCPHRAYCAVGNRSALEKVFGGPARAGEDGGETMSLLSKLLPSAVSPEVAKEIVNLREAELPPGFRDAVIVIASAVAWGLPQLSGEAARLWCHVQGGDLQGGGLAGAGKLAALTISDPAQVIDLAKEITLAPRPDEVEAIAPPTAPIAPRPQPEVPITHREVGLLPPDAPESKPELAAKPVAETPEMKRVSKIAAGIKGRPPKAVSEPTGTTLYVDAIPSTAFQRLEPWIDALMAKIAAQYSAVDIRCGAADGPLGYGRWKGVLAGLARETELPAGALVLLRPSEVSDVVIEAITPRLAVLVRGVS